MYLLKLSSILLAVDADDPSALAIAGGAALASAAGAMLHVVHVVPAGTDAAGIERVREKLTALVAPHLPRSGAPGGAAGITCHVEAGEAGPCIRGAAARVEAAVVVLGAHRSSARAEGRTLGSTALDVAVQSGVPCLIAQGDLRLPLSSILVPVDLSKDSDSALAVALTWASALRSPAGASLRFDIVHVRQPGLELEGRLEGAIADVRAEAGSWAGVSVHGGVIEGAGVSAAIIERAREGSADLIVMGRRGRTVSRTDGVGSVAAEVVLQSGRPVLLVPLRSTLAGTRSGA